MRKGKGEISGQVNWKHTLQKTRTPFLGRLQQVWETLSGEEGWNPGHPLWETLEEVLLSSDMGPRMSQILLEKLKEDCKEKPSKDYLISRIHTHMLEALPQPSKQSNKQETETTSHSPRVTLLIGVNGSGKTTTAGKLAYQKKMEGRTVILGAADTFRAAAVEQLQVWAKRVGVECVAPAKSATPAAVAFEAVSMGISKNIDEVIIDIAGRLHTKENLMDELKKIGRVVQKKIPTAPHCVLLVLDATLGQNALFQAKEFTAALQVDAVVLTKLDGSAKGGAAFSVVTELGIPIQYVGVGETIGDLKPFSSEEFVRNLLPAPSQAP